MLNFSFRKAVLSAFLFVMILIVGMGLATSENFIDTVYGESGKLYTCSVHPTYKNPLTGKVEDPGGENSYATGQGMVNSAIGSKGLLEVTKSGDIYLVIKVRLMDQTSGHTFKVQNSGQTEWVKTEAGITAKGRDGSGTTGDVCIPLPSKDAVIRAEMYVKPMGRKVIFFISTDNISAGNTSGMKPAVVTSDSGESDTLSKKNTNRKSDSELKTDKQDGNKQGSDSSEGLSLSTAQKKEAPGSTKTQSTAFRIFINVISIVIGGIILMVISLIVLYVMKDQIKEWFKTYPDDEYMYEDE